jgi:hypothetical protein
VSVRVLVRDWVLVRRSGVTALDRCWRHLTPKSEHPEDEKSDPIWAFAQLRFLGLSLVPVRHSNLVGLIRVACAPAHTQNATGACAALRETGGSQHGIHSSPAPKARSETGLIQTFRWHTMSQDSGFV